MTAYQDYHAGHLIYNHNMGHESQPKEQVFINAIEDRTTEDHLSLAYQNVYLRFLLMITFCVTHAVYSRSTL